VGLPHRADDALPDHLDHTAVVVPGVDLGAHLRDELLARRQFGQGAGLGDGMRQRLFAVGVQALGQGPVGDVEVVVVRGGAQDGIEPPGVDHLAEVGEEGGLRELLAGPGGHPLVHVAQGDDLAGRDLGQLAPVVGPLGPDPDDADADPLAGRGGLQERGAGGRGGGGHQEMAAGQHERTPGRESGGRIIIAVGRSKGKGP
jgi:hypothetical protein